VNNREQFSADLFEGRPIGGYAWVPVIGPILGGVVGAWVYVALWTA
jgi:glycerol uptake facilitator-like aquaporin